MNELALKVEDLRLVLQSSIHFYETHRTRSVVIGSCWSIELGIGRTSWHGRGSENLRRHDEHNQDSIHRGRIGWSVRSSHHASQTACKVRKRESSEQGLQALLCFLRIHTLTIQRSVLKKEIHHI